MRTAWIAARPIGTTRSFDPLPRARSTASSRSTSEISMPIASDARRPHAYMSSSRARSRSAVGAVPRGWSSSFCTSPRFRTFGSLRPRRGPVIVAGGSGSRTVSRGRGRENERRQGALRGGGGGAGSGGGGGGKGGGGGPFGGGGGGAPGARPVPRGGGGGEGGIRPGPPP